MPNIREFSAPQGLGLNPTETGIEATAGAARRIGGFYNQAADAQNTVAGLKNDEGSRIAGAVKDVGQVAVDYMDHREISAGAAHGAELIATVNDAWNQKLKDPNFDPNDTTAAAKFREETLAPALEQFQSGFNTEKSQAWAEQFVDHYRQHMFEKTAADMSTMAGVALKANYEKTINGLSSAVASDPSSLDFALRSVDHSLGAMVDSSPNLDAAAAAGVKTEISLKAKEAIVKAAVSGMITQNPNTDLDAIQKKYGDYINGAEMKMFAKAAQTQAKVDAYHDKSAAIAQRQLDDQKVHAGATKVISDNVSIDQQTGSPIIKPKFFNDALELARKNPDAPSAGATVRTMLDWGASLLNKENKPVDDPTVKSDLMTRMFSADKPTTTLDLMRARADGKISDHTFEAYQGLVQELEQTPLKGPVWHDTIEGVKAELVLSNVGLPGKDITGEGNYAKWAQTFIPQYLAKSRAGTLPPNALDVKDPTSLISQSMAPFKRTVQQRAQDYLSVLSGEPAAGAARKIGDVPVPAALGGVASLQYNKTTKQWRDQTSGTVYDSAGQPVTK
jgi:hypothetical protein